MTTHSIVFVIFLLYVTTIDCRNVPENSHARRFWHNIIDKIGDKFDLDNRHFDNEEMLLFPDVGFQSLEDVNTWKLMVHGWRYRNSKRKDWLSFSASTWIDKLARNLVNHDDILHLNGTINRDRLRPFFVTDNSDEPIDIKIGDQTQTVRTDKYGEFYEHIEVKNDRIQQLKQQQQQKRSVVTYEAIDDDDEKSTGVIHLIEPSEGISVISDIDDTIKISEVLDKVRLLANTFVYPFKAVPGKYKKCLNFISICSTGMSDLYQQWQAKYPNCSFHYLSGMPDQLYTLTQEFINTNNFPDGSFHMRHFGWAVASLFDFLHSESTFTHKISYLNFFLTNTKRDYVLIGDSGEKDPEIYGTITRQFPQRIRAIFIRAIKGEAFDDQRFIKAFEGVPQEKWLVFNDPKQVPIDLSRSPRTIAG
jgi:phosphatidate phosphatase APP1